MNYVEVLNGPEWMKILTGRVIHHCIKELMPRMRTLDITVEFSDNMGATAGAVLDIDNRMFEIELAMHLDRDELIKTICHEMIHVKQYARGEMKAKGLGSVMWRNKEYTSNPEGYYEYPWEVEAYSMEECLVKSFISGISIL